MRERFGCLVLVCLVGCGEVKAKMPDGGSGGGGDDGDVETIDGGVDAASACMPSACGSGYCDPMTDMCLPETSAIYVSPTGTDGAACGSKAAPCMTIGGANGALAKVGPVRNVVMLAAGTYLEALRLSVPVTIFGPGAIIVPPTAGITVNVDSSTGDVRLEGVMVKSATAGDQSSHPVYCQTNATVRLIDVTIADAKGYGVYSQGCKLIEIVRGTIKNGARSALNTATSATKIHVDGTTVTGNAASGLVAFGANIELVVTDATVTNNTGTGVSASGGAILTLERSLIKGNTFGVSINGAAFTIRNNMVVENGVATNSFGGVALKNIVDRSPEVFEFNTIVNNAGGTLARNLSCEATANTPILMTSSIVYGGTGAAPSYGSTTPANCSVTYSNVEGGVAGVGNINMAPMYKAAGDYHLLATSPGVSDANPGTTLDVDFDGDARPNGPGRDMGADEVH